jgi:hypothetical protein
MYPNQKLTFTWLGENLLICDQNNYVNLSRVADLDPTMYGQVPRCWGDEMAKFHADPSHNDVNEQYFLFTNVYNYLNGEYVHPDLFVIIMEKVPDHVRQEILTQYNKAAEKIRLLSLLALHDN